MIGIRAAMTGLRDRLDPLTIRQVTTDPTRTSATPCVLVEVPQIEPAGTLCGEVTYRHTVLVIGQPGAWLELGPLDELLNEILTGLDDLGIAWSLAEPVAYTPLVQDGSADPCMAYRITMEEFR